MQNALPMWKLAETERGIGSGQEGQSCSHKKCSQVFKHPQSEWSCWAACGVNKHKGEVSAQRNLRDPHLKQDAGHNSAYIHLAQAFEILESGVWDSLAGNGKSASAWDNSMEQASKLHPPQIGGQEQPLPLTATGVWWLIQVSLISGRFILLSSAKLNYRQYLYSFSRIWHPHSNPERIVRTWTQWCFAGSCGTGPSLHHSLQKSGLGPSCHCSHIFYKCFQLAKDSHSNRGHTWKEEQAQWWRAMTFPSAVPFFLWPCLCHQELMTVCSY